ncbi:MAG: D-alanyl-D-alanine carboxypeptidase, partial [Clostridiales bacterium]
GTGVAAKAAALIECRSGRVLFLQQGKIPLPPASTSKIITALTVLDLADVNEIASISPAAAAVGESSIHLRPGESLTVEDLLKGALLRSGNDACFALAEQTAGSERLFVQWLNLKTQALGIYDANLVNTNGLPAENHLISAVDLAIIAGYALENEIFADIVASKYAEIGQGISYRHLQNTNKLLWHDTNIEGVKTGTTDAAGSCLIAARNAAPAHFVSVVLDSVDRYGQSLRLLDYGTNHYLLQQLFQKGEIVAAIPRGRNGWRRLAVQSDCWLLTAAWERAEARIKWCLRGDNAGKPGDYAGSFTVTDGQGNSLLRGELVV